MITWCFINASHSINLVDLWSVMFYFIYDAATCSIAATRSSSPTMGTWAPVPGSWGQVSPPWSRQEQGLAALLCWPVSQTSLPSLTMNHLCLRAVIFASVDVHKTCCGQSTRPEQVTKLLTPRRGLEWVATGSNFPVCAAFVSRRAKQGTFLVWAPPSSPTRDRSHQEQRVQLCASSGPSWPSFFLSFTSRKIHMSPINELQTSVNNSRLLFSGWRALLFMKLSIKNDVFCWYILWIREGLMGVPEPACVQARRQAHDIFVIRVIWQVGL